MKLAMAAIVAVSAALMVGLPIVLSGAAVAQDPAVDALLKRLERMERDIGTLDRQVYRENLPAPGSPTPLPPAGVAQSNPPKTIIEKWSCNGGQITLTSSCSRDGRGGFRECSGQVKTRSFKADAAFKMDGIEGFMELKRQWWWQPDRDGRFSYTYVIDVLDRDRDSWRGMFHRLKRKQDEFPTRHNCKKTR